MAVNQRNINLGKLRAFPIEHIGDNSEQRIKEAKHSGKIILPSFVLRRISRTEQSLMVFKLINELLDKEVFCGVLVFDGDEQKVSVPNWMMNQLRIEVGDKVFVELVLSPIPKGEFAKFEPMTKSFLEITDPKAVLEHCLRNYVCITREDIISIYYNGNIYELRICVTLPTDTIVINECDLTVDFQEMKRTVEELPEECDLDQIQQQNGRTSFEAFSGAGQSTSGKKGSTDSNGSNAENPNEDNHKTIKIKQKIGIPDFDYEIGTIFFKRYKSDLTQTEPNSNKSRQKQEIRNKDPKKDRNEENKKNATQRPVTRSITRQLETVVNQSRTETETTAQIQGPSSRKKRKKSVKKKNN